MYGSLIAHSCETPVCIEFLAKTLAKTFSDVTISALCQIQNRPPGRSLLGART